MLGGCFPLPGVAPAKGGQIWGALILLACTANSPTRQQRVPPCRGPRVPPGSWAEPGCGLTHGVARAGGAAEAGRLFPAPGTLPGQRTHPAGRSLGPPEAGASTPSFSLAFGLLLPPLLPGNRSPARLTPRGWRLSRGRGRQKWGRFGHVPEQLRARPRAPLPAGQPEPGGVPVTSLPPVAACGGWGRGRSRGYFPCLPATGGNKARRRFRGAAGPGEASPGCPALV